MNHWLVKQEPEDYAFARFVRDKRTEWTGVRNYTARNFLRAMKKGDAVLYYHSGKEKAVVGTATVRREASPDPTMEADETKGEWVAVELQAGTTLARPVPLAEMRKDPRLSNLLLLKQSRLSVTPLSQEEHDHILRAAGHDA